MEKFNAELERVDSLRLKIAAQIVESAKEAKRMYQHVLDIPALLSFQSELQSISGTSDRCY